MPYTKDGGWVPDPKQDGLFRPLTPAEVKEFQEYALENEAPENQVFMHPVCRAIWNT